MVSVGPGTTRAACVIKAATTTLPSGGTDEAKGSHDKHLGGLEEQTTVHATVLGEVNGVKARIMLDTAAGSTYISLDLLAGLNLKLQ